MPNFVELSFCSGQDSSPIHSGPLLCLVGKTIGDTRRTKVNQNDEDEAAAEAAARAGAAARVTCDVSTLRGTYVYRDHGVYSNTGEQFAGAGREYFDGNGNIIRGKLTSNVDGAISRDSFQGTYEVNPDCTGRSTYPGNPEYKYDLYIHPEGDMLTWVQVEPVGSEVVSAVEQRVTLKRVGV
jgi:hypothetical protein